MKDLLDDAHLHRRLYLSACILAELLKHAPHSASIAQLEAAVDSDGQVGQMCDKLWRNGLLQPDVKKRGHWMLADPPSRITLADLFAALLHDPPARGNHR